jgi:hypothetical protein
MLPSLFVTALFWASRAIAQPINPGDAFTLKPTLTDSLAWMKDLHIMFHHGSFHPD